MRNGYTRNVKLVRKGEGSRVGCVVRVGEGVGVMVCVCWKRRRKRGKFERVMWGG